MMSVYLYAALVRNLLNRFPPNPQITHQLQAHILQHAAYKIVGVVGQTNNGRRGARLSSRGQRERDRRQSRGCWVSIRFVFNISNPCNILENVYLLPFLHNEESERVSACVGFWYHLFIAKNVNLNNCRSSRTQNMHIYVQIRSISMYNIYCLVS